MSGAKLIWQYIHHLPSLNIIININISIISLLLLIQSDYNYNNLTPKVKL